MTSGICRKMRKTTIQKIEKGIAVTAVWLALWWLCAALIGKTVVLPYPHHVARTLVALAATGDFWGSSALSIFRILLGFVLGVLFGIFLAVAAHRFQIVDALFSPLVQIVRATPVASFIILLLVLMARVQIPTFICFLMVLPVVYVNVRAGLANVDPHLREVAQIYDFSFGKQLKLLYLPAVVPHLASASRTALGLAWKAGIAAEVLCATKNSIGIEILDAKNYLMTESLFAWTIVVILLSLVLEWGMLRLASYVQRRMGVEHI